MNLFVIEEGIERLKQVGPACRKIQQHKINRLILIEEAIALGVLGATAKDIEVINLSMNVNFPQNHQIQSVDFVRSKVYQRTINIELASRR